MPIIVIQRRMMELGRIRLGEKGKKGEPKRLDKFRFTSASRELLEAAAAKYGGTVREWQGAPDDGYFELYSTAAALDIILPPVFSDIDGRPTVPYSQYFESWSGGGCQRRCDGVTEMLSGKPCPCGAAVAKNGEDARLCKPTTRVSLMLPDLPGVGVWRVESHGWNAAVELPGTLEVLQLAAAGRQFIPAVLRIEHRTKKEPGKPPSRYIVPVIDLPTVTLGQLAAGEAPTAINAPPPRPPRPELPAGPAAPEGEAAGFAVEAAETPPLGEAPVLPLGEWARGGEKTGPTEVPATPPRPSADMGGEEKRAGQDVEEPPQEPSRTATGLVGGASNTAADRPAAESEVTGLLELAASAGDEAHEKTLAAVLRQREAHAGNVSARWLKRTAEALLEQPRAPSGPTDEPEDGGSLFKAPVSRRG